MDRDVFSQTFFFLILCCLGLSYMFRENKGSASSPSRSASPSKAKHASYASLEVEDAQDNDDQTDSPTDGKSPSSVRDYQFFAFQAFQKNYLVVYSLVMMSDWLQGPYIYALYKEYGYGLQEIAILFVVGFLSSAIFGTMIGGLADKVGRKRMCLVFCILYSISCLTKLSSNFNWLLLGRLTGGVSTSLLFSVFEAWMVSEHNSRGFKSDLLSSTFSWATFLNGMVAIGSGVVAEYVVGRYGNVAPFMTAIGFLMTAFCVVFLTWKENYGSEGNTESSVMGLKRAAKIVVNDPNILSCGLIQSFFESAMYTFVFLYAPVLESATKQLTGAQQANLPYGVIFASFMVSVMIGSVIFRALVKDFQWTTERIAKSVLTLSTLTFFLPTFISSRNLLFLVFNIFEATCGIYWPMIGTLRSKWVPEEIRATAMNLFRVPLNIIVVVLLTKVDAWKTESLFFICTMFLAVATFLSWRLEQGLSKKGVVGSGSGNGSGSVNGSPGQKKTTYVSSH